MAATPRIRIKTAADARSYLESRGALADVEICGEHVTVEKACRRCGGSGHYSYCAMYGTLCFECRARGGAPRWHEKMTLVAYAKLVRRRELADARRARKREEKRLQWEQRAREREEKMLAGQRRWCEANGWGPITFAEKAEIERARKAAREHVGTVGQRAEFDVTLGATRSFRRPSYSGFGEETVVIYVFRDDAGNKLVWFTSGAGLYLREGQKARIRATVKKHDEYDGEPQTRLSRVTLAEKIEAA